VKSLIRVENYLHGFGFHRNSSIIAGQRAGWACTFNGGICVPGNIWLYAAGIMADLNPVNEPTRFGAACRIACTRSQTCLASAEAETDAGLGWFRTGHCRQATEQ